MVGSFVGGNRRVTKKMVVLISEESASPNLNFGNESGPMRWLFQVKVDKLCFGESIEANEPLFDGYLLIYAAPCDPCTLLRGGQTIPHCEKDIR